MNQLVNHLEASIKREITKLYKIAFGKGPGETTVKIFNDTVFIRFDGGLSQIEENIMMLENGEEIVRNARNLLLEQNSAYLSSVEEIVNSKIYDSGYAFGKKNNALYLTLVFENNITSN